VSNLHIILLYCSYNKKNIQKTFFKYSITSGKHSPNICIYGANALWMFTECFLKHSELTFRGRKKVSTGEHVWTFCKNICTTYTLCSLDVCWILKIVLGTRSWDGDLHSDRHPVFLLIMAMDKQPLYITRPTSGVEIGSQSINVRLILRLSHRPWPNWPEPRVALSVTS
jgi:hypothetical protein